jgi:hypothetical protein
LKFKTKQNNQIKKKKILIHCMCKCKHHNQYKQKEWKYGFEDNYNIININTNVYPVKINKTINKLLRNFFLEKKNKIIIYKTYLLDNIRM